MCGGTVTNALESGTLLSLGKLECATGKFLISLSLSVPLMRAHITSIPTAWRLNSNGQKKPQWAQQNALKH